MSESMWISLLPLAPKSCSPALTLGVRDTSCTLWEGRSQPARQRYDSLPFWRQGSVLKLLLSHKIKTKSLRIWFFILQSLSPEYEGHLTQEIFLVCYDYGNICYEYNFAEPLQKIHRVFSSCKDELLPYIERVVWLNFVVHWKHTGILVPVMIFTLPAKCIM